MCTKYLNMKTKLHKTIGNIYFNKEWLKRKLTPTYEKIKIKDTNKAATKQDRNNLLLDGRTVENKGKLILTEIFPSVQKHDI